MKAKRRSTDTTAVFLIPDAKWGWLDNATPRPLYHQETVTLPTVQEAVWTPVPIWIGAENLSPSRILSLDCRARSESLYRLSNTGPHNPSNTTYILHRYEKLATCFGQSDVRRRAVRVIRQKIKLQLQIC
jgi:hypothetical protein